MKLKERMQRHAKLQGKSPKTFETYWHWCSEFFEYCRIKNGSWIHPKDCGRKEIENWLTYLANDRHVSKNTQNLALQSVLYLYREILGITIEGVKAMRSTKTVTVRDVLDVSELQRLFDHMDGVGLLAAQMMYGCGLRIGDLIGLRIKDISFERKQIAVKTAKGDKWRYVSFPEVLHDSVRRQIDSVRVLHRHDEQDNPNGVSLPGAYRRKSPSAARSIMWYWLFPSDSLSKGDEGILCRHHRDPSHIARQIKQAAERAGIEKRVTSHILRHCFATHSHENGVPLRTLMMLLGHNDIATTEIYTHADQNLATAAKSPLETLLATPGRRKPPAEPAKPFVLRVVG